MTTWKFTSLESHEGESVWHEQHDGAGSALESLKTTFPLAGWYEFLETDDCVVLDMGDWIVWAQPV